MVAEGTEQGTAPGRKRAKTPLRTSAMIRGGPPALVRWAHTASSSAPSASPRGGQLASQAGRGPIANGSRSLETQRGQGHRGQAGAPQRLPSGVSAQKRPSGQVSLRISTPSAHGNSQSAETQGWAGRGWPGRGDSTSASASQTRLTGVPGNPCPLARPGQACWPAGVLSDTLGKLCQNTAQGKSERTTCGPCTAP